jgi:hypothetical protein
VAGGRYVRYGWIGGRRERARGEYRFSSLVKQKKKGKLRCLLLHRKKKNIYFYIYEVFTLEFF